MTKRATTSSKRKRELLKERRKTKRAETERTVVPRRKAA